MVRYQRPLIEETSWDDPHRNYTSADGGIIMVDCAADTAITVTDTFVESVTAPVVGDIWPELTPMYFDSGVPKTWKVWTAGEAVEGFLVSDGLSSKFFGRPQLDVALETSQRLLIAGEVDAQSVYVPEGETRAALDTAMASTTRERQFIIRNLPNDQFH